MEGGGEGGGGGGFRPGEEKHERKDIYVACVNGNICRAMRRAVCAFFAPFVFACRFVYLQAFYAFLFILSIVCL